MKSHKNARLTPHSRAELVRSSGGRNHELHEAAAQAR